MKLLIAIVAIILGMALLGWMSFDRSGDGASATVNTEKIQNDTQAAVEKGEELFDEAVGKGKKLIDSADEKPNDDEDSNVHAPTTDTD